MSKHAQPTLIRAWVDGYGEKPVHRFVEWEDGRFALDADDPLIKALRDLSSPLTVYSTDEIEWLIDRVDHFRASGRVCFTCVSRTARLRWSLASDACLIESWLAAEKDHARRPAA